MGRMSLRIALSRYENQIAPRIHAMPLTMTVRCALLA
jgi:hypothetical protein